MAYVETVIGILAAGAGVFATYTLMRMKNLETQIFQLRDFYENFPSPDELAKQILNTKLHISELPEAMKEDIMNAAKKIYDKDNKVPTPKPVGPEYVG